MTFLRLFIICPTRMEVGVTTGAVDAASSVAASLTVAASLLVMTGAVTTNAVTTNAVTTGMEAAAEMVETAVEVVLATVDAV